MTEPPSATERDIPAATIGRLPAYLRQITQFLEEGVRVVSSESLARAAAVQPALLRRDLSYLGTYGTRGVGYDVDRLARAIGRHIGWENQWRIAVVGAGHLGRAMAASQLRNPRGFDVVAVIDPDPGLAGTLVGGCTVSPPERMAEVFAATRPEIAVLSTPAAVAQQMCDQIVALGVGAILNFAPTVLTVPAGVMLRSVDLTGELQILAFHVARRMSGDADPGAGVAGVRAGQSDEAGDEGDVPDEQ